MARKNLSMYDVIDMSELNKIVKKTDLVIWEKLNDGRHFVCNSHFFAVIVNLESFPLFGTLAAMFGKTPSSGECLEYRINCGSHDSLPMASKFMNDLYTPFSASYTGIILDRKTCGDPDNICLFAIDGRIITGIAEKYFKLIAGGETKAIKDAANVPLLFGDPENDMLYILPVNLRGNAIVEKLQAVL